MLIEPHVLRLPLQIDRPRAPASTRVSGRTRFMRPRPAFVIALALSIVVHVAFSFWPEPVAVAPDEVPLQATITEMPPPPVIVATAPVAKPKPKPNARAATRVRVPRAIAEPTVESLAQATPDLAPPPLMDEAPVLPSAMPQVPALAEQRDLPLPPTVDPGKTLPPRIDLAYRVFLGTQGFYIGDATYRFEHHGNRYRIHSVGEARGLAALLLRGQGKLESEGLITTAGLQPDQFALVRGAGRKREVAQFDWESGMVSLDDNKSEALELPTYDPLAFLWQFYFLPPATGEQTFAIATTRKVYHYTFTREATEWIELASGAVETERWHRRSDDGKTDAFVWLAPKMHYVAVKLRFANTERGTVEALLDGIRVDETVATQ